MTIAPCESPITWIAFDGDQRLAIGSPQEVAEGVWRYLRANPHGQPLAFDAATSYPVEMDLRGSLAEVLARLPVADRPAAETEPSAEPAGAAGPRGRGRPRLGVVPREVTLLPRHWDWLAGQPGGASVALRKLVESALREYRDRDARRLGQEALYRFMSVIAGNAPGFEAATRAVFAGDRASFEETIALWPPDVREHCLALSSGAFAGSV
ncbi:MAG: DUF2239 family protein [Pseudomonadales bacterium]